MIRRAPLRRSTKPIKRSAIRRRTPKPRKGDNPAYRAWIRQQWCVICLHVTGSEDGSPHIECAHVGPRGLGQKCSDNDILPICVRHHRTGPHSHHVLGKKFWAQHGLASADGLNRDKLIAEHQQRFLREGGVLL